MRHLFSRELFRTDGFVAAEPGPRGEQPGRVHGSRVAEPFPPDHPLDSSLSSKNRVDTYSMRRYPSHINHGKEFPGFAICEGGSAVFRWFPGRRSVCPQAEKFLEGVPPPAILAGSAHFPKNENPGVRATHVGNPGRNGAPGDAQNAGSHV